MGKTKKDKTKESKVRKPLAIIGYVLCGLMLVMGVVTAFFAVKTKMFPASYLVIGGMLLVILAAVFVYCQKWTIGGIVTKVMTLSIIVLLGIGTNYLHYTYEKLRQMSGINTQIDTVQVYVMKGDPADTLNEAKKYRFGIMKDLDRENTDTYMKQIEKETGEKVVCSEYDRAYDMVDALYSGEVQAIIFNDAYLGILTDTEGYMDFEDKVKSIAYQEIITELDEFDVPEDYLYGGDHIFTIYISGSDVEGKPSANERSDVNILMTVNMDTRQILLINTPRDFFVPLSISNGQKDKLTHAGIYGVDCSRDTMAKLYNVKIDHYLKINFTGFEKVIDAIGGITVHSDVEFSIDGYDFKVGDNRCTGKTALLFTRERHQFVDGDRQRGRNQMAVIEGVVRELSSANTAVNYKNILDKTSDCVITSMSYDEITDLVRFQLSDMRGWEMLKYSVNGFDAMGYTYSWPNEELYVMEPDYTTVATAKRYLTSMYRGEKISVEEQ